MTEQKFHCGNFYKGMKSHKSKENYIIGNGLSETDRNYLSEKVRKGVYVWNSSEIFSNSVN